MRIESMHVGMKVLHPDYGLGTVKGVSEYMTEIRFDGGLKTLAPDQCDLKPAEAQAEIAEVVNLIWHVNSYDVVKAS